MTDISPNDMILNDIAVKRPESRRITFFLLYTFLMVNISSFFFGYQLGVINSPKDAITKCSRRPNDYFQPCIPMSELQWTIAVSIFNIGGLIAGLTAGSIADTFGRKLTIHITNLALIIGSILMSLFSNYYLFVAGRVLVGYGAGAITVVAPMYLSEIAPTFLRGFFGNAFEFSNAFAILVSQVLGIWLSTHSGWRYLLGVQIVVSVIHSIFHIGSIESPRWLFTVNRHIDARKALESIRGSDQQSIQDELESFQTKGIVQSFKWRNTLLTPLIIGIGLHVMQPLSGINAIFFYSTSLFESSGVANPEAMTAVVGGAAAITTVLCGLIIEKVGRRPLLLTGQLVCLIAFLILPFSFIFNFVAPVVMNVVSVVACVMFVIGFSWSLGPIPWIMISEILPNDARGTLSGIIVTINWSCVFLVTLTFPFLLQWLKNYTFFVYAGQMVLFMIFAFFVIPETKGLSIEEITKNW